MKRYVLHHAVFDSLSVIPNKLEDIPIYTLIGKVTNSIGQMLLATATGPTQESVANYFAEAKFYFEVRKEPPASTPPEGMKPMEPHKLSASTLFSLKNDKDETMNNLLINLELSPETIESLEDKKGYLFVHIDPTVSQYQYNIYRARNIQNTARITTSAQITTKVGSKVTGSLYFNCGLVANRTAYYGNPATLNGSCGSGWYDIAVRGINPGGNKYALSWDYLYFDYSTWVPSSATQNITC